MLKQTLTEEEKAKELEQVKDILLATLDYSIANYQKIITADFNSDEHYKNLKEQVLQKFEKGNLSTLKQWLRDFTEEPRETRDFAYVKYIKEVTGYDFDIFEVFKKRIEKIIANNKITLENQYRDVLEMVDYLSQTEPVDENAITLLNGLLIKFENKGKIGKGRVVKANNKNKGNPWKILQQEKSPNGIRWFKIHESGNLQNGATQIIVDFGTGSGAGVFTALNLNVNITAKWLDDETIEVSIPKNLKILWQRDSAGFFNEFINIIYREE